MTELFEYVKLSQNNEGYVTVEVLMQDRTAAIDTYVNIISELKDEGILVANPNELETKATNENTKLLPTVTVKGRGEVVVTKYISELARMKNEV